MAVIDQLIKENNSIVHDKVKDSNRIMQILYFRYAMDTFKLAFIILNICYFVGLAWYTLCIAE